MINDTKKIKLIPESFSLEPKDFTKYEHKIKPKKVETKTKIKSYNWNEDDCMSDDLWARYYGYD